jgi:uncharacterized secreted protein with C-terminal beta-propeller domain
MTEQFEMGDPSAGRGIGALLGGLGLVAALTVGALALDSGTPAAASGLERFDSCAELQTWTDDLQAAPAFEGDTEDMALEEGRTVAGVPAAAPTSVATASGAASGPVADADRSAEVRRDTAGADASSSAGDAATGSSAGGGTGGTGGTNTVVEGVDEVDVIDRVAEDRLLVSRNGVLALVELSSLSLVAELPGLPPDARISVAAGVVFAAGSSRDFTGTEVVRVRIDGDTLVEEGRWSTPGYLLDARRTGDRLHVVAVDQPFDAGVVPFEDGPVPCDQVWRPVEPATTAAATLVATLPAEGSLEPTAVAEVTGSGGNLLVTGDAVYVVTETYDDAGQVSSGIHRFELATLAPTGSGAVPGAVAGPFALSEHEGHLRVATSRTGGFVGRPVPIEGDGSIGGPAVDVPAAEVTIEPAPAPNAVGAAEPAVAPEPVSATATAAPASDTTVPGTDTTVPGTDPDVPLPTTSVPGTSTTVAETTTTVTETTTTVAESTTTTEAVSDEGALAEVFVLDLEGDLDVVGSTGRFGRAFETIHGVRFVGDLGYVVTFLQSDPFWVLDLSDPAAPAVVGELQIPGFSGYLHPVGDDRVVGFGPDGNGRIAARLFDVTDPSAPSVVDELVLGDDSPVAYDHHAFVGLGDARFAVPVTDYPQYVGGACFESVPDVRDPIVDPDTTIVEPVPLPAPEPGPAEGGDDSVRPGGGATGIAVGEPVPTCEPPQPVGGRTGAVVLAVVDGRLQVTEEATMERPELTAERVVQAPDGSWIILSYDRLAATSGGQELVLPLG